MNSLLVHRHTGWLGIGAAFLLAGCVPLLVAAPSGPTPRPTRTPLPWVTAGPSTPGPPGAVTADHATASSPPPEGPPDVILQPGWEVLAPGLELRTAWMWIGSLPDPVEITIIRINPAYYNIRTHYALADPATVADWHARTQAAVLVNGAFFEPNDRVLGLFVEDGQAYSHSFYGHGGMLSVAGDEVLVRSLAYDPVRVDEQFDYAVQGRPMLLHPGGLMADFDLSAEASRRTAIAQDRDGNILFIVNDYGAVSLYALREWLAASPELNLNAAFNLDGGGSTGLALQVGDRSILINSWWGVATAVAAYPKTP